LLEVGSWAVSERPLALRPRLAAGLPFATTPEIGAMELALELSRQLFDPQRRER